MVRDDPAWEAATWEGLRRVQRREFRALPLREKLAIVEQMGEVAALFADKRNARAPRSQAKESRRFDSSSRLKQAQRVSTRGAVLRGPGYSPPGR